MIAKVAQEQWNKMSAEDKQPYEAKAAADKTRFKAEMKAYNNAKGANYSGDDTSESEDSEDLPLASRRI